MIEGHDIYLFWAESKSYPPLAIYWLNAFDFVILGLMMSL